MAVTLRQAESLPASYPSVTAYPHRPAYTGSSDPMHDDAVIDPSLIWQRLESYIVHRWTARAVVWTVEGPGEWIPPLTPVVGSITWELWDAVNGWEAVTVDAGPLGYCLDTSGTYRATATVGSGTPPEAVLEAWRRLHEFTRGIAEQFKGDVATISGDGGEVVRGWTGKAMQLSGAADLLRPYRREG